MYVPTYARLFTAICSVAIICFILTILHTARCPDVVADQQALRLLSQKIGATPEKKVATDAFLQDNMKYILQWTPGKNSPFHFMGQGRSAFLKNKCEYKNCFVTDKRDYFLDITDFDAVAFSGREIFQMRQHQLPNKRSLRQKYIFGMMESSHNYGDCWGRLNGFFNWTWTYRLDSDVRWGYVTAYDRQGAVVAPSPDPRWPEQMDPPGENVLNHLSSKTKAAAWFVTNCRSKSEREPFAMNLKKELKNYGLVLDIYGSCGSFKCPRSNYRHCNEMLQRDYYFYLSFENSFAEDYVTEKLLNAMDNYAVPIVYGGANYSR